MKRKERTLISIAIFFFLQKKLLGSILIDGFSSFFTETQSFNMYPISYNATYPKKASKRIRIFLIENDETNTPNIKGKNK
jgi:hypothetical protein